MRDDTHDPLADDKLFLDRYQGVTQADDTDTSLSESSLANRLEKIKPNLDVDEPELCKIIEEHFGRHIYSN